MKVFMPLNYIPIKKTAENLLNRKYGWQPYKDKHQVRFTRFYEDFWLPNKFGYQKRRAHFSSLILTNQMTREEALERISRPEMSEEFLIKEFEYVADKLDLTKSQLQEIFDGKNKSFRDYNSKIKLINFGAMVMQKLRLKQDYLDNGNYY